MTAFEKWWKSEGQYVRAGGGDYEKSFAFAAWNHTAKNAPAWHDAPTVPGLWVCRQAITDNVQAYEVTDQMALNRNLKLKGQWYGPIPEDRQ